MSFVKGLKCRECGTPAPLAPVAICEECFGPLEVDYDYDAIKQTLTLESIASRPKTMWRYRELLPLAEGERAEGARHLLEHPRAVDVDPVHLPLLPQRRVRAE